jgi:small subunit ribosomal protein S17e
MGADAVGNIRQLHIKNTALELLQRYPDLFRPDDFEHNKTLVNQLVIVESKVVRNRIAGYVTRRLSPHERHQLVQEDT